MIKSFRHKGLLLFFETGSKAGIQTTHAAKLARQLRHLNDAAAPADMEIPGWRLHALHGYNPKGQPLDKHWSVTVSGNWRMTFCFEGTNAILVDYQDYH